MSEIRPGYVEVAAYFSTAHAGKSSSAGVRVRFSPNQSPGIAFEVDVPSEFLLPLEEGLRAGLEDWYPGYLETGRLSVINVEVDEINSSSSSFEQAGRLVIQLAHSQQALQTDTSGSSSG